jgi:PAS domain S-box-containing protein
MSPAQPATRLDEIAPTVDSANAAAGRHDRAADTSPGHARALQDDLARRIAVAPVADPPTAPRVGIADALDEANQGDFAFLSTVTASPAAWQLAIAVVVFSALTFVVAIPFVRVPLQNMPAFIPAYQSALAINDLITSILLFGQFNRLRSRALLPLATGYLFCALLIVLHTLTFPGVFAPAGLLGAGSQSTAWLYVFWHAGFPVSLIAYAALRGRDGDDAGHMRAQRTAPAIAAAIATCVVVVAALAAVATAGMDWLPVIISNGDYSLLVSKGVSPALMMLSLLALLALWRLPRTTVLDLWLMVTMCVWLCDVGLSAVFGSARYDLGWYAGRTYGLLAASFVLGVLLLETNSLHGRLASARLQLADRARDLARRVRERTRELQASNDALEGEIAERRLAEHKLLSSRTFLDTVIESVPAVVMVKDAKDRQCILLNRAGEQLMGRGRGELIGKTGVAWMPEEDARIVAALEDEVLASEKLLPPQEHRIQTRDHGLRLLRTRKVRALDENGNPRYVIGFSEDITDQRRLEEQLNHAQKMEALGQLTGGLAHDFNNLLAIIIGNLDILTELGQRTPQEQELQKDALDAALRGSELIRRLLAFARRQPLKPGEIDVNALIGDISKLLARTIGESVLIKLDLDPGIPRIMADAAQLETSIANLANNARDAMPKGGRLTIATRMAHLDRDYAAQHSEVEPGDYVAIEVTDTGDGMPPEVCDKIFEPFFTTKAPGKGTGLGLSMVFGFIKQSGGHINVYSEPGHGTTFRLYFPILTPAVEQNGSEQDPTQGCRPKSSGETILVVEDNAGLLRVVVKQLTDLGYRVLEANTAHKALEILDGEQVIDLLFTDVVMPGGMDGCELAQEVLKRRPDAKVLLTSGFPGTCLAETEGFGGDMRLLSKPYRKDDLTRVVREVLEEKAA